MSKSTSATADAPLNAEDAAELLGGFDPMTGADDLDAELAGAGMPPAGMPVNWDLDECELSDRAPRLFRPIEDGWRDYRIVEAERGFSKAGNKQLAFLFECCDPETSVNGVNVEDYAVVDSRSPKAHFKIKMIAKAVGKLDAKNQVKAKAEDFIGLSLAIKTKLDTDYDPSNPRTKAVDFAPAGYRG
jgi:hypothetical protein